MTRPTVLVVAPPRQLVQWEEPLRAQGLEVVSASSRAEARAASTSRSPSVIVISEKLPMAGALRVTRELRRDPGTREAPVVLVGVAPFTTAQRLRLGAGAPDATVPPGATPEALAAVVAEALRKGKLPPVELSPAQQTGMRYSRIGTMLMLFGVVFTMPLGGGKSSEARAWWILLIPVGGLVSDWATGKVDGRKKLLSWQGWAALAIAAAMSVAILLWPGWFRWPSLR
ncbi:MAG TPA: hypothetical protein VFG59_04400 [Anaeromyxobacter sp.]|nr:hypothetical protein [Anaeromyxobacter sp.]